MLFMLDDSIEIRYLFLRLQRVDCDLRFRDCVMIGECYGLDILPGSHLDKVTYGTQLLGTTVTLVQLDIWYFAECYTAPEQLAVIDDILFNGVEIFVLSLEVFVVFNQGL